MGVIRVLVCPDDGVDLADARVEQLQPHIGAGVDKNTEAAERYHDRRAAAQIAWIVGIALTPVVADPRHARRRSATQDSQLHKTRDVMAPTCLKARKNWRSWPP